LGGALVAAMLLGTTFSVNSAFNEFWLPSGAVLLPLVLAISGVCISTVCSTIAALKKWKTPAAYLIEKMISAFLMIVAAFILIQLLLPYSWVLNGLEHTSLEVFFAAQTGIIMGLLTNKVTEVYRSVHRKYFTYLVHKSFERNFLDKAFHFFINALSTMMPVLLIIFSILLSFYLVGLYGILIALVAMLANVTTRLTIGK
jgi:K(+)-stimulated pyrophosphate-energized sodium pump